jgi:predicted N-acetyltransferase YhbS
VYPFALAGDDLDGERIVERVIAQGDRWRLGARNQLRAVGAHRLRLTDVWERADSHEQLFTGAAVDLPEVHVTPTAGEEYAFDCQVELRFSRLGNHHLRVQSPLPDGDLHDINQALRRASRSMGEEKLASAGTTWGRFVDYAREVIDGAAAALGATAVGNPTADFHAILAVRDLVIQHSYGSTPARGLAELRGAVGASLILNPVRHLATSLEEWVRYPTPDVENLMQGAGYVGDVVIRTPNTTVIFMPESPEWAFDEYEEMAEFVAAMPPLIEAWEARIHRHSGGLQRYLRHMERGADPADDQRFADFDLSAILGREATLRRLQTDVQHDLAQLHSPRLVRDRTHREFLDRLWDAASLPAHESGLERQLEVISTLHERVSALASAIREEVRRKAQQRQARIERYAKVGAALLAVASLTQLLDWVETTFDIHARALSYAGAAFLLALALVVVVLTVGRPPLRMRLRELGPDAEDAVVERFHREVLAPAFPSDELETAASLAARLRGASEPAGLALVALGDGDEILGGLVAERYTAEGVLLLAYLAVRPKARGRGVATALMERAADTWYADERVKLAVAEVHDPAHWSVSEGSRASARLRLFARLGARRLPIAFVQPRVEAGRGRVAGMLLLALYADERVTGGGGVPSALVDGWLRRYFEVSEAIRPPYDPELTALLSEIGREDRLPLLPLE